MKIISLTFLIGLISINMCSCLSIRSYNKDFIDKYGNEKFDDFRNKSLFVRDTDKKSTTILFYDYKTNQSPCGFLLFHVNDNKIIHSELVKYSDSCSIAENKISDSLVLRFVKYEINRIRVDSLNNVFVSVFNGDNSKRLVRFSDIKYKTREYKNWSEITENWYEEN